MNGWEKKKEWKREVLRKGGVESRKERRKRNNIVKKRKTGEISVCEKQSGQLTREWILSIDHYDKKSHLETLTCKEWKRNICLDDNGDNYGDDTIESNLLRNAKVCDLACYI